MIQVNALDRMQKFKAKAPTSPVCDLSCSSSLQGLLYDFPQPEKVQWYFFFAFFTSEPFTKANPIFFLELRGTRESSESGSSSCQETSLCSLFESDAESCRSKVSDVTLLFRLPRTVMVVRGMRWSS